MSNPTEIHEEDMVDLIRWMRKAIHYDETDHFYAPSEMSTEELEKWVKEGTHLYNRLRRALGFSLQKEVT